MAEIDVTESPVVEKDVQYTLTELELKVSELAAKVKKLEHLVSILSPSIIARQKWD